MAQKFSTVGPTSAQTSLAVEMLLVPEALHRSHSLQPLIVDCRNIRYSISLQSPAMTEPERNAASSDCSSNGNSSLMSGLKRNSTDDDSIFGESEGENEETNLLGKKFRTIEALPPDVEICAAEVTYEDSSRNARTLIVLCRGIVDVEDGKQLQMIDITIPPWSKVMPKKSITPTNAEYVTELRRRWHKFAGIPTDFKRMPKPSKCTTNELTKWLDENPITDEAEVACLRARAAELKATIEEAALERAAALNMEDSCGRQWTDEATKLRFIMILVEDDEANALFKRRLDISNNRLEIENRHSVDKRPHTVWDRATIVWNSSGFNPTQFLFPNLHKDFCTRRDLSHEAMRGFERATPDKLKRIYDQIACDMGVVKGRWEASGIGDGSKFVEDQKLDNAEPDLESNKRKSTLVGEDDNRKDFLHTESSTVLYMWQVFREYQLVTSSLQVLSSEVASSNGAEGVPSVSRLNTTSKGPTGESAGGGEKKRKSKSTSGTAAEVDHSGLEQSISSIGASVLDAAKLDAQNQKEMLEMTLKHQRESDTIKSLRADLDGLQKRKGDNQDKYDDEEASDRPRAARRARLDKEIKKIEVDIAKKEVLLSELEGTSTRSTATA